MTGIKNTKTRLEEGNGKNDKKSLHKKLTEKQERRRVKIDLKCVSWTN